MAAPVKFNSKPKPTKPNADNTDFNFGFNALSQSEKRKYNRSIGRRGTAAGGS